MTDTLEITDLKVHFAGRRGAPIRAVDGVSLSIAPGETFIAGKRAHALMFLGRVDEARSIYLGHRGEQANGQPWEKLTLDDFAALRNVGLSHPLMEEIQMTFATKL